MHIKPCLWMSEVSSMEDWYVVRVVTPQEDPSPGLRPQEHGDDGHGVLVNQRSVHLPHLVSDSVGLHT